MKNNRVLLGSLVTHKKSKRILKVEAYKSDDKSLLLLSDNLIYKRKDLKLLRIGDRVSFIKDKNKVALTILTFNVGGYIVIDDKSGISKILSKGNHYSEFEVV